MGLGRVSTSFSIFRVRVFSRGFLFLKTSRVPSFVAGFA